MWNFVRYFRQVVRRQVLETLREVFLEGPGDRRIEDATEYVWERLWLAVLLSEKESGHGVAQFTKFLTNAVGWRTRDWMRTQRNVNRQMRDRGEPIFGPE